MHFSFAASACLVGRSQTKILFLMGQVSTDLIKYAQTQLGENIKVFVPSSNPTVSPSRPLTCFAQRRTGIQCSLA